MKSNLSKTFKYVNELGQSITFEPDDGFIINKPVGIDSVTINLSQAQGINQIGSSVQSRNVQARPVTVSGRLLGYFQSKNKDRLISVIRPDLKGRFYADDFYLDVDVTQTPTIEPKPRNARFSFSLLAAYPYWQNKNHATVTLSGVEPAFKLPCNFTKPYRFGRVVDKKFINLTNRSQLPIPFSVSFTAREGCTNPKITNSSNLKFLQINKSMVAQERIDVLITHDKTFVTSTVDGDIRGALSLESNLNRLEVGDNVLKPETDEGTGKLDVSVNYSEEILGVTL